MTAFNIQIGSLATNQITVQIGEYTNVFLQKSYELYVCNESGDLEKGNFAYKVFHEDKKLLLSVIFYPPEKSVNYLLKFPKFTTTELEKEK